MELLAHWAFAITSGTLARESPSIELCCCLFLFPYLVYTTPSSPVAYNFCLGSILALHSNASFLIRCGVSPCLKAPNLSNSPQKLVYIVLCGPFRSYHEWEWSPNFRWVSQGLGYTLLLVLFYVLSYWGVKYGKCSRSTCKVVPIAGGPGWNMFSNQTPYWSQSLRSIDLMMDWHDFVGLVVEKFETAKQPIRSLGLIQM